MARSKKGENADKIWGLTRISLGLIFLWAFVDKVFGLGFATCRADDGAINVMCQSAWLEGGSPTTGFLQFGTQGPFAETFQSMAGNGFIDWLFMLALLGLGVALILGIGIKIAGYGGALLMLLMWLAILPPQHHPFIDEHIIYGLVLLGLVRVNATQKFGFGAQWKSTSLVKKLPILT